MRSGGAKWGPALILSRRTRSPIWRRLDTNVDSVMPCSWTYDGRQKRSVGTAVRLSVTVMSCLSLSHSLTVRVVVLVHVYAGLVQKPTSQVAQERTQPRDAQERFRRSIQRFHATVWQCVVPGIQLHVRRRLQRLGLETDESTRVQDVSMESESCRSSFSRSPSSIHGPFSAADVLWISHKYVRYVTV